MSSLLTVDGVELPAPTEYSVSYSDIDSSDTGRSETGVLLRNRVRSGIAKISVSWKMLSQAETDRVLDAVAASSMTVQYNGGTKTAKMYAGDKTLQLAFLDNDGARYDLSFNLIEF